MAQDKPQARPSSSIDRELSALCGIERQIAAQNAEMDHATAVLSRTPPSPALADAARDLVDRLAAVVHPQPMPKHRPTIAALPVFGTRC